MGSMIHLAVGRLEIDWGKNSGFTDHSALFQPSDLTEVPYYYVDGDKTYTDETGEERYQLIAEQKDGMSKPLGQVVDRIRLLGHTERVCEREFQFLAEFNEFDTARFAYSELTDALAGIDVNKISADYGEMGEDFGKFFRRQIAPRLGLNAAVRDPDYVSFDAAYAMENLSAYTILTLLIRNPQAREVPVNWQFADVEDGGWANRGDFVRTLAPQNRFLIVTEGSSDAKVLEKAFALLKPHIADFFHFVDMEEGYPFTGTGNLFRFVQGLISISVLNNIIVLYDNDAEGVANFTRSNALNVPANMKILRLPDHAGFAGFETEGPSGRSRTDVNGRAVAIECFLDLGRDPLIRWSGYNATSERYQGELVNKGAYLKSFLAQRSRLESYDYTKLEILLNTIVEACVAMREAGAMAEFESKIYE